MVIQKKRIKKFYNYKCGLTGRTFRTGAAAPHPEDLVCVDAYYDVHPEKDDRPEQIKKQRKQVAEAIALAQENAANQDGGRSNDK